MGALNFIAGLAAVILVLELLAVTILGAALCGGVWYGLRLVKRKSHSAFDKVNGYVDKTRVVEHGALRYVVAPVIVAHSLGENIGVTVSKLVKQVREGRARTR